MSSAEMFTQLKTFEQMRVYTGYLMALCYEKQDTIIFAKNSEVIVSWYVGHGQKMILHC